MMVVTDLELRFVALVVIVRKLQPCKKGPAGFSPKKSPPVIGVTPNARAFAYETKV
jgi:hypothetical protein